jgi:hypothetical protein
MAKNEMGTLAGGFEISRGEMGTGATAFSASSL